MADSDPLLSYIERLKPDRVLDIGCGCGSFTVKLAPHCEQITAIDVSESLVERCGTENGRSNITYRCMDARQIEFPGGHFDLALARASLHHVRDWRSVVDEMLRVCTVGILIEEPLEDHRSDAKRNTIRAQQLFLELHAEVGYSHYAYVTPDELTNHLRQRDLRFECEITRRDEPVGFDEFFESWGFFADKSARKDYWIQRLSDYRRELGDGQLCENDIVVISARK